MESFKVFYLLKIIVWCGMDMVLVVVFLILGVFGGFKVLCLIWVGLWNMGKLCW